MALEVLDLVVCYDTAMILDGVSFRVNDGEFVSIVGPNGAGKTTLLRTISGLMDWEKEITRGMRKEISNIIIGGKIIFNGEVISNLSVCERVKRGLILCPERGRPFRELSVLENLRVGAYLCDSRKLERENLDRVYDLFPRLKEKEKQRAGTLSGGERTMLAIGRSLMYQPKLLLVDEPSTGLAPKVKEEMFRRIENIYHRGVTILLVEQDVSFAFSLASRNYVISRGKIISEGSANELLSNERIRKIYLGI